MSMLPLELIYHTTTNPGYSVTAEELVNVLKNNPIKMLDVLKSK